MSHRSRHVPLALLWLLLALLPLRAWAGVAMHLPAPDAMSPCHAEAQAGMPGTDDDAPANGTPCSLCGVCHGGALPVDAGVMAPATCFAQALPAARPGAPPVRDPEALFRPPRI